MTDVVLSLRPPGERAAYWEGRIAALDGRVEKLKDEIRRAKFTRRILVQGVKRARQEQSEEAAARDR